MNTLDCLVIGGGFAGLQCANRLQAAGLAVHLLEARDRLGGRTRVAPLAGRTVDIGGQWIGADHDELTALAQAAGANIVPQYAQGARLLHLASGGRDRLKRYRGLIPNANPLALLELDRAIRRINRASQTLNLETPWESAKARDWDHETLATWKQRHLRTRTGREIFDIAVRSVMTAEPGMLSLLGFLFYCASNKGFEALTSVDGGAQAATVDGGMVQLAEHLAAPLRADDRVTLQADVSRVTLTEQGWRVEDREQRSWHARRLVCALPPALQDRIAFEPALPANRAQLANRMPMGSVIKVVVAYPTPFWRQAGLSGEAVSHSLPFNTVFDASPQDGSSGALVGFIDGGPARIWSAHTPDERRRAVLDSLVRYFGPDAADPLDYVEHDWISDPWSRGCYVGLMTPGLLTELGPALRTPWSGIHWAGTETATEFCGYIEGAIRSGQRAADEVRTALADRRR